MNMKGRKNRDEDLLLFKELHKRENDRLPSLLQPPVSDEFEPNHVIYQSNGNCALYRIASGNKGSGYEFFGENDKNDYDWLKTPPATPLFPSLEMEAANAPQLVLQREIPTVQQPLSRFASTTEALKGSRGSSKPKIPVTVRSATPSSQRPSQSKNAKRNQNMSQYLSKLDDHSQKRNPTATAKNMNIVVDSKAKPTTITSVVSPRLIKSAHQLVLGFSNDTPPNLRTDRASSATRGRPAVSSSNSTLSIQQKSTRHSCSPCVTRGRKETTEAIITNPHNWKFNNNNRTQIFGSRMVDKLMNARKLGAEEREAKPKPLAANDSSNSSCGGIGKIVLSSTNSMAMEIKRDRIINPRHFGFVPGKKCHPGVN